MACGKNMIHASAQAFRDDPKLVGEVLNVIPQHRH
jgi:hypothetical protein